MSKTVHIVSAIIVEGSIGENPTEEVYPIRVPAGVYSMTEGADTVVLQDGNYFYRVKKDSWEDPNMQHMLDFSDFNEAAEPFNDDVSDDVSDYDGVLDRLIDKLIIDGGVGAEEYFDQQQNADRAKQWIETALTDELVSSIEAKSAERVKSVSGKEYLATLDKVAADELYGSFKSYFTGVISGKMSEGYVRRNAMRLNDTNEMFDIFKSKATKVNNDLAKHVGPHSVTQNGVKHEFRVLPGSKASLTGPRKNTLRLPLDKGILMMRNNGFWKMALEDGVLVTSNQSGVELDKDFANMLAELGALLGGVVKNADGQDKQSKIW